MSVFFIKDIFTIINYSNTKLQHCNTGVYSQYNVFATTCERSFYLKYQYIK